MPPKSKCTKEQIVEAALQMVREEGMESLKARELAARLGTSTAPIFTAFHSIEEIQKEVMEKARSLYSEYIQKGLKQEPAFKGVGMKYIEFAKDEPELFKVLFMSDEKENLVAHFLPSYDDNFPEVLEVLRSAYGISMEAAKKLYNHMSVYAFGFATLYAQRIYMFTMEDISRMLSEVFAAMIKKEKEEEKISHRRI